MLNYSNITRNKIDKALSSNKAANATNRLAICDKSPNSLSEELTIELSKDNFSKNDLPLQQYSIILNAIKDGKLQEKYIDNYLYNADRKQRCDEITNAMQTILDCIDEKKIFKNIATLLGGHHEIIEDVKINSRYDANNASELIVASAIQNILNGNYLKQEANIIKYETKLINDFYNQITPALDSPNISAKNFPLILSGTLLILDELVAVEYQKNILCFNLDCDFLFHSSNTIRTALATKLILHQMNKADDKQKNEIFKNLLEYSNINIKEYQLPSAEKYKNLRHDISFIKHNLAHTKYSLDEIKFLKNINKLDEILTQKLDGISEAKIKTITTDIKRPMGHIFVNLINGNNDGIMVSIDQRRNIGEIIIPEKKIEDDFIFHNGMNIINQKTETIYNTGAFSGDHILFRTDMSRQDESFIIFRNEENPIMPNPQDNEFQNTRNLCKNIYEKTDNILKYIQIKEYSEIFNNVESENFIVIEFDIATKNLKIFASNKYFEKNFPSYLYKIERLEKDDNADSDIYTLLLPLKKYQTSQSLINNNEIETSQRSQEEMQQKGQKQELQLLSEIGKIYGSSQKFSTILKKLKKIGVEFSVGEGVGKGSHESLTYNKRSFPVPHDIWMDKKTFFWTMFKNAITSLQIPLEDLKKILEEK